MQNLDILATHQRKIEQVVGCTIMNKNSFSAVVVGFEEVDEVNGHFPMSQNRPDPFMDN